MKMTPNDLGSLVCSEQQSEQNKFENKAFSY